MPKALPAAQFQIPLRDLGATQKLGAQLAAFLRAGDVVRCFGDLGAGKTSLVRATIQSLCGEIEVPSPTYTLVETYETPIGPLYHFDLYRLEAADEVWELGLEDALDGAITIIEWPERLGDIALPPAIDLRLTHSGDTQSRQAALFFPQPMLGRLSGHKFA